VVVVLVMVRTSSPREMAGEERTRKREETLRTKEDTYTSTAASA
jgi:hypothetical protein